MKGLEKLAGGHQVIHSRDKDGLAWKGITEVGTCYSASSLEPEATARLVNGLAEGCKEKRKIKNLRTSGLCVWPLLRRKARGRVCWGNWFGYAGIEVQRDSPDGWRCLCYFRVREINLGQR